MTDEIGCKDVSNAKLVQNLRVFFLRIRLLSCNSPHVFVEPFGVDARNVHLVIEGNQVGLAVDMEHGGLDTFDVFALRKFG